jgi:hypothetical protein
MASLISFGYPKESPPPKTCNKPYMFLAAAQPLQPLWEFLRPQHVVVGQFVAYPVEAEGYVQLFRLKSPVYCQDWHEFSSCFAGNIRAFPVDTYSSKGWTAILSNRQWREIGFPAD